jgi:hypothetical protein
MTKQDCAADAKSLGCIVFSSAIVYTDPRLQLFHILACILFLMSLLEFHFCFFFFLFWNGGNDEDIHFLESCVGL